VQRSLVACVDGAPDGVGDLAAVFIAPASPARVLVALGGGAGRHW
jgi:hypothetical protein